MTTYEPTPRAGGFHPVHVSHLVLGLAFLGLTGVWLAVQADLVPTDNVRWLLPLPWVFAGVAGLLAVSMSGRSGSPVNEPLEPPSAPVEEPYDEPGEVPVDQTYAEHAEHDLPEGEPSEAEILDDGT